MYVFVYFAQEILYKIFYTNCTELVIIFNKLSAMWQNCSFTLSRFLYRAMKSIRLHRTYLNVWDYKTYGPRVLKPLQNFTPKLQT